MPWCLAICHQIISAQNTGTAWLCTFSLLAHSNSIRHVKIIHFSLFHIEGHIKLGQYGEKGTYTPYSRATLENMHSTSDTDTNHCIWYKLPHVGPQISYEEKKIQNFSGLTHCTLCLIKNITISNMSESTCRIQGTAVISYHTTILATSFLYFSSPSQLKCNRWSIQAGPLPEPPCLALSFSLSLATSAWESFQSTLLISRNCQPGQADNSDQRSETSLPSNTIGPNLQPSSIRQSSLHNINYIRYKPSCLIGHQTKWWQVKPCNATAAFGCEYHYEPGSRM